MKQSPINPHRKTPPRWAEALLERFCPDQDLEEVQGDLAELYVYWLQTRGKRTADWCYVYNALRLLRPFGRMPLLGKRESSSSMPVHSPVSTSLLAPVSIHSNIPIHPLAIDTIMLRNYLKIALRNLFKNKAYSFINIGGLAVGMCVATLIGLWVYDEVSYDTSHPNYADIAQIRHFSTYPGTGVTTTGESIQIPLGTALKGNYKPYFKHILMTFWAGDFTVSYGDKKIPSYGRFIEPGVIDMLSLKMLNGNASALSDPHSVILSASKAKAIFGNENPINQTLKIDNRIDVTVTGVFEDLPQNTSFGDLEFFAPWDLWVSSNDWVKECVNKWDNSSFTIFVQLAPNTSVETANAAIRNFYARQFPKDFAKDIAKYKPVLFLYPMKQWHLYSEFENGIAVGGRITFVWLFGIIGVFVLLLACINFMNLSTARSEKRAREVGIRKAIGSVRSQLVGQFLGESLLIACLAFVASVVLTVLSLPWFNQLASKDITFPLDKPLFWLVCLVFLLLTGFLAGLYPAFYLSSFQPIKVLKGTLRQGRYAALPRKLLVVVQFTVSVALIIGTIIVYRQIQHAQNRPVGYNREGLIHVPHNDPNYKGRQQVLTSQLINTGMVSDVAYSSSPLTAVWNNSGGYTWTGKDPELASDFSVIRVSHNFGKTVGWQFIAGRDFSKEFSTDSTGVIINEAAARYISPAKSSIQNLIGQTIKYNDNSRSWRVLGIVKDMVMQSPYEPVKRGFFFLDATHRETNRIVLKISPTVSATQALPAIEAVFRRIVPSAAFDYQFVDSEYGRKFSAEQQIGQLASVFAVLAIFISCLGIFGLASFTAEQRRKEIGIRKILGASVGNLWKLLSKDFLVLVVVSCLLATPIAWYFLSRWLQTYTYRIELSWWIFVVAAAAALLITLLTVSYQAIKTALANPVKSLRTE
ncbi:ABC transporter permease [Xanthocytophaga agilis]|uniref:ABC transporter permease n=1 Tax=Xanthocytophaga agilis TaxID=3048010 RepID=A0AAE3UJV6_9BACT|nr:ABC transporter permease [Xanthocytophaga agilis]MDJ1505788.1 ABC transporter permease [Xanthocytophaga agilis]